MQTQRPEHTFFGPTPDFQVGHRANEHPGGELNRATEDSAAARFKVGLVHSDALRIQVASRLEDQIS